MDVDPNATGLVRFEITGPENYTVYSEVENGRAIIDDTLMSGNYTAHVTYMGDDNFNPNSTDLEFTVVGHVKKNTPISAVPEVSGDLVTITVNVDPAATGYVTFNFRGKTLIAEVTDGKAVLADFYNFGTHRIDVTYTGDENYNANSTTVSFTVIEKVGEMKNTTIKVDVESTENNVTITAQVESLATGLIEFDIAGQSVYIAVINGVATYKTMLAAGDYEVGVSYLGDAHYNPNSTSKEFTVTGHVKKNTTIVPDVDMVGYDVVITVSLNSNATGFVKLSDGNSTANLEVADGKATYKGIFLPGEYTFTAIYLGDINYNANETSFSFTVDKIPLNTTITANVSVVENNITITVNVDPDATGLVRFDITGPENYTVYTEVKNGKAVLNDTLMTGNYTAIVTYMGDDNFNPNSTELEFTVVGHLKKDTPISANATAIGNMVTITVDVDPAATGYVTFTIMGKTLIAEVINGKASLTDFYNPETYQVDVEYMGDENYNTNSTTVSFTVVGNVNELENTTIDVDVVSNENNVTITAKVDSLATGLIEFNITGQAVYIPVNNGVATYETMLAAGEYNVTATYLGDERFNPNSTSKEFTVTGHVKKNTTIVPDVDMVGYDVVITVSLNSNATGFVKLSDGNSTANLEVADGKATYKGIFLPGEYTFTAIYLGDINYNANETSFSFTVDKIPANTTITADVSVVENNITITVNVDPNATGLVRFDITGPENYIVYTEVENGQTVLEDTLKTGDYTAVITYMGDDNYNANSTTVSFTVGKKQAISLKESRFRNLTVGNDFVIYIVLKDETDNIIANAPITYTINGTAGTTTTAADGSFTIKAANGAKVFIKYAGNETILPTNLTLTINIPAPSVVKIATHFDIADRAITINGYAVDGPANEQGIYYATTLLDANGKPVSNVYIEFAVNNKIYNRTTYENGSFKPYKLNMIRAGRYTMAFNFAGDDNYTNAFACVCVDLDKKPITIKASAKTYKVATKTKKYTVTLSTIKGVDGKMYLSPKVVKLTVNGRTYTAKTNAKYQATFKINNLKKAGKYIAKITYKGDKTYEAASKKVKITVK